MADSSKVNIKNLPVLTEVKTGDYLILETPVGTRLLDFKNFIISEYNTTFYAAISSNTDKISDNLTTIKTLTGIFTGSDSALKVGTETVSVSALGVGTHTPHTGYQIDIQDTGSAGILIGSTDGTRAVIVFDGGGNGDASGGDYSYIQHDASDALTIRNTIGDIVLVNDSGNVGIGSHYSLEPTYMLDISATGTTPALRVKTNHASGTPKIRLENGSQKYSIKIDPENNNALDLFDETNSSARLTINAQYGYLGIGSNPDTVLHVGSNRACATFDACTVTPSDPSSSAEGRIYIKGGKLIVQYNANGTVKYKYLDLALNGVAWQHSTTAP